MQNNLPLFTPNQCDNLPADLKHSIGCEADFFIPKSSFLKRLLRRVGVPAVMLLIILISSGTSKVQAQANSWKGITSDWNVGSNWSTGVVPTSTSTVTVSAIGTLVLGVPVGFNPVLSATGNCKTLTMANNTTISGTPTLIIATAAVATNTIVISGTSTISCPLSISGATTLAITTSLTVANLLGSGDIKTSTGTLTIGNPITTFGKLTIASGTLNMGSGTSSFSGQLVMSNGTLNLNGNTTVNGLIQLTRGTLYIGSNTLIANAGISSGALGVLSGSQSSNLTLNGNTGEVLNFNTGGGEVLNNLTLNHGASANTLLGTDLIIYGGITFNSANDNLDFAGFLVTLKSNAAGTAYVGEIKGQLLNATHVVAERYIDCGVEFTGKRSWRLLSIPVSVLSIRDAWCGSAPNPDATGGSDPALPNIGTLITGHGYSDGTIAANAGYDWFQGLSGLTTSSIRYYNSLKSWTSSTNTPDITAAPDKEGYMLYVRGDRSIANNVDGGYTTLTPTGELYQGPKTVTVNEQYTVVGNPYASPVNLDEIYKNTGNSSKITRNFWVWDATLGTSGGYRALSGDVNGDYTMTGGSGTASEYLIANSGQAFFVEKNGAGGTITIEENDKVATTTPPIMFRPTGTTGSGVSKLDIKLFQATGSTVELQADGVVGRYNDIYSVSPYETYDAAKLNNFNENLSLVRSGRYMSIESRPYPTQKDTLFISFWGLKNRDYAFTITSSMFAGLNQTAKLVDNFTNTQIMLDLSDASVTYPFAVTSNAASSSLNRFMIVMAPSTVLPVTFTKINAALVGSKVQVSWATGSELGVKNYSVERSADGTRFNKIGEVAATNAATGASYQFADNQPLSAINYYRIRSNDADGKYAYSSIAAVQLNAKKGMQVMPTVISNQRFTLALNDQPAGNYQLKITNTAGQQVYQKLINNIGGSNTQVIELGNMPMPTGVYNLSVNGLNGVNQNFRLLINN